MSKITPFRLSKEDTIQLAKNALEKGEQENAITYLKEALEIDSSFTKASIMLAKIYNEIEATVISNAVLYHALAYADSEDDKTRIIYLLSTNYLSLNQPDVSEYYWRMMGIDFEVNADSEEYEDDDDFTVTYPKGQGYYSKLIKTAKEYLEEEEYEKAAKIVEEIPPSSDLYDIASQIIVACHSVKNNLDDMIDAAKKRLANKDCLTIKCALATAYLIKGHDDAAMRIVEEIENENHTEEDEVLLVLPLYISLQMHQQIIKYTTIALNNNKFHPNLMIWLAEAMYNTGDRAGAKRVLFRVKNLYANFISADYFISLFDKQPESVPYDAQEPSKSVIDKFAEIEGYFKLNGEELEKELSIDSNLRRLIMRAFKENHEKVVQNVIFMLRNYMAVWIHDLYDEKLLSVDLSYEVMSLILSQLMFKYNDFRFKLVAQDRYKECNVKPPDNLELYPYILRMAFKLALCDIIYTDEEPQIYLDRLTEEFNKLTVVSDNGILSFGLLDIGQLMKLRSEQTLAGVMLMRVYRDDPDPYSDSILRYNLNKKTFNKYLALIIGEER